MKAVIRVRRGKSWRYVVRGTWAKNGPLPARTFMRMWASGTSVRTIACWFLIPIRQAEQVIREARGARWWRE